MSPHSAALSVDPCALSGRADVLAREAARYHVNNASPWPSVEGLNVIPDREGIEASVILSGDQNVPCVGVPFDGAHGSESAEESAEYAATSACE